MENCLHNKTAFITGAGRGIGKSIAIAYAANGANICCISRTEREIHETASVIQQNGGNALPIVCDVTKYPDLLQAFLKAEKQFNGIDIVVINAGTDCGNSPVEKLLH